MIKGWEDCINQEIKNCFICCYGNKNKCPDCANKDACDLIYKMMEEDQKNGKRNV